MTTRARAIGGVIAPPRFLLFLGLALAAVPAGIAALGWRLGIMAGFDVAAAAFLATCRPLLRSEAAAMRRAAARNDANRVLLLGVSALVTLAVLVSVAAELAQRGAPRPGELVAIIITLLLSWVFSNTVYALHYAHLFYSQEANGGDRGGLQFPGTVEPDYGDFVYFAFCLGMCFQTSDVTIADQAMRRVATGHCLVAFVFNLGVLAFTINTLGG